MARPLYQIAAEIRKDWTNMSVYAKPYVDALACLNSITDTYLADTADDIVLRFLVNAQTWRGETARRIKQELKDLLKTLKK